MFTGDFIYLFILSKKGDFIYSKIWRSDKIYKESDNREEKEKSLQKEKVHK